MADNYSAWSLKFAFDAGDSDASINAMNKHLGHLEKQINKARKAELDHAKATEVLGKQLKKGAISKKEYDRAMKESERLMKRATGYTEKQTKAYKDQAKELDKLADKQKKVGLFGKDGSVTTGFMNKIEHTLNLPPELRDLIDKNRGGIKLLLPAGLSVALMTKLGSMGQRAADDLDQFRRAAGSLGIKGTNTGMELGTTLKALERLAPNMNRDQIFEAMRDAAEMIGEAQVEPDAQRNKDFLAAGIDVNKLAGKPLHEQMHLLAKSFMEIEDVNKRIALQRMTLGDSAADMMTKELANHELYTQRLKIAADSVAVISDKELEARRKIQQQLDDQLGAAEANISETGFAMFNAVRDASKSLAAAAVQTFNDHYDQLRTQSYDFKNDTGNLPTYKGSGYDERASRFGYGSYDMSGQVINPGWGSLKVGQDRGIMYTLQQGLADEFEMQRQIMLSMLPSDVIEGTVEKRRAAAAAEAKRLEEAKRAADRATEAEKARKELAEQQVKNFRPLLEAAMRGRESYMTPEQQARARYEAEVRTLNARHAAEEISYKQYVKLHDLIAEDYRMSESKRKETELKRKTDPIDAALKQRGVGGKSALDQILERERSRLEEIDKKTSESKTSQDHLVGNSYEFVAARKRAQQETAREHARSERRNKLIDQSRRETVRELKELRSALTNQHTAV